MLHFILGRAKSGKTSYIQSLISKRAENNLKTYFLVPEQATFQNEKKLCSILPPNSYNTSVTGFRQLSEAIFSLYGKNGKKEGGDVEKLLIMSSAAGILSSELSFYKKYPANVPFLQELIALYDELANSGTSPCDLSLFSLKQQDGILKTKTHELSLILDLYEQLYSESYSSEGEEYARCAHLINKNSSYFKDFNIFIDDFVSFTYPQRLILQALINSCSDVYIALNAQKCEDEAFASACETMRLLKQHCCKNDIPFEETVLNESFINENLKPLECAAARLYAEDEGKKCSNLYTISAKNPTEELESCASIIKKLVRQKNFRFKDFAIFIPDFEKYAPLMENVFKRYEVPFFSDELSSKDFSPLVSGVAAAAKTAAGIRDFDLTDLAFSPINGIDVMDAGDFLNYCYVWSLSLKDQLSEFKNNPQGIKENFTDKDREQLAGIENTRKNLAEPIIRLKAAFSKGSLKDSAKGIYSYLQECNAVKNIFSIAAKMDDAEREEFLSEQNQVWEKLCDILDLFVKLSPSVKISSAQFAEILTMAVSSIKVSTIPKALDLVDIGSPKRMRTDEPKCVFILGTSMGSFPQTASENHILNDHDRCLMIENSLLVTDLYSEELLERAVCYRCLTAASDFVFVSICRNDSKGEEMVPSFVFSMCRKLSSHSSITPDSLFLIESPLSLRDQLAKSIGENNSVSAAIKSASEECLSSKDIARIENARGKITHKIENRELAQKLFGKNMLLSPSQVECFYSCKYKYFLKYGLKLKPLLKAKLDNMQTGTLIHHLLQFILEKYGKTIDESRLPEIEKDLLEETDNYIKSRITDSSSVSSRERYNFYSIARWVLELIKYLALELGQSKFTPQFFEMPIKEGEMVEPVKLKSRFKEVSVFGVVDRVDTAQIDGKNYVRIIDYKSGSKDFLLGDVMEGLNMQMLIYLFSIWENGKACFHDPIPAGILYQPSLGKYVNAGRNEKLKAQSEHNKGFKMNGLLLNDLKALEGMDKNLNGEFIPFKGSKDKGDWTFSIEEFKILKNLVEKKLIDMAESLSDGDISDLPAKKKNILHCEYCDYYSICSHRKDGEGKEIADIKKEEFLKEAEEYVKD